MYITKQLALRMESCIKQTHIEVTRNYAQGKVLELNGGAACFSGFDSYLSQVVGWGFASHLKQFRSEIEAIEQFYKALNHSRVDIEFCPFAGNDLAVFLGERGYKVSELNNVSVLDLNTWQPVNASSDPFIIREIGPFELDEWTKQVAAGFGFPEAQDQFSHYVRARGVKAFAAFENELMVAGGTIAIHSDVADLGVTSTLPAYRGRGLQKKLMSVRLGAASQNGVELATVTTEPGTVSDLNVQKMGFCCAYTRIKMTLEPFNFQMG